MEPIPKPEENKIRGFEPPPSQTLYIRNLNEKIKPDGNFSYCFLAYLLSYRN